MSLRLVYFIPKLVVLVILDQEKIVFVIFFCTENVVHRRSRNTVFVLLKLKNSPVVENPLSQNIVEMSQFFALLFAPLFGSSQRKS